MLKYASSQYIAPGDWPLSLLVIGGSQGSSIVSKITAEAVTLLPENLRMNLRVACQVRKEDSYKIEKIFLEACGFKTPLCHYNQKPRNPRDKELLFNGLTAVISYLCKLDSVPNVMDYSKLFEYENNEPIYHLETILKSSNDDE